MAKLAVPGILLVLVVIPTGRCIDCVGDTTSPGCKAVCDGTTIDISSIFEYPVEFPGFRTNETFKFDCNGGLRCTENNQDNTVMCQGEQYYYGVNTAATWTLQQRNPMNFTINYSGGACGPQGCTQSQLSFSEQSDAGSPKINFIAVDINILLFQVSGQCLSGDCAPAENIAGPIGFVLIALSIIAFAAYFVVGSLVMYQVKKARGIEIIPHLSFWLDFPFLLRDGFFFTISPCYSRDTSKTASYNNL